MDLFDELLVQLRLALLITAVGFVMERVRPIDKKQRFSASLFNLAYLPIYLLIASLLQRVYASLAAMPQGLIEWPRAPWAQALCTLLLFATYDFFYYWVHRLQHHFPRLWEGHSFHHSDPSVNASTRNRTHWIEGPITFALAVIPTFIIWPPPPAWAYIAITTWSYFIHANLDLSFGPLRHLVVGPHYHRIHHSIETIHHGKNLASFLPLWDILFGTHFDPAKVDLKHVRTGLPGHPDWHAKHVLSALIEPALRTVVPRSSLFKIPARGE